MRPFRLTYYGTVILRPSSDRDRFRLIDQNVGSALSSAHAAYKRVMLSRISLGRPVNATHIPLS